jgi:hypothetical protein
MMSAGDQSGSESHRREEQSDDVAVALDEVTPSKLGVNVCFAMYVDDPRQFAIIDWPEGPIVVECRPDSRLTARLELGSDGDWLPDDDDLDVLLDWSDTEAEIVYEAMTDAVWLQMAIPATDADSVRRCYAYLTALGRASSSNGAILSGLR